MLECCSTKPLKNAVTKSTICRQVEQLATERYAGSLRAIVLTGSLARDEGSFAYDLHMVRVLGDVELFLVFDKRSLLPEWAAIRSLERQIETALMQSGVAVHVTLSPVQPVYFQKLQRHIFSYELRAWGQVLWGDKHILALIPEFSAADIESEDAWRLLNNRMLEVLEVSPVLVDTRCALPPEMAYRTIKLYLDMATSYLVFRREYEPCYRRRSEKLAGIAASGPFPWFEAFSRRVAHCTAMKLSGAVESQVRLEFWREGVEYARQLWVWELNQLSGVESGLLGPDLFAGWARRQPNRRRIRGWAYVLRRCGWHRSWRHWLRWARCAMLASPRYCIYAAGSELLFRLPALLDAGQDQNEVFDRLYTLLPVTRQRSQTNWQALALEIAWNYHEFLEATTA